MSSKSNEEMKQDYIDKMGPEFAIVFHKLRNELIWLTIKWKEFEILFTKESRVTILNKSAPTFTHMLQNVLWENIVLSISKITDPEKSGKFKSISAMLLPGYIDDLELKNQIDLSVAKLNETSKSFRLLRDKWIAHQDFNQVLNEKDEKLYWPSLQSIREFLSLCYEVMNAIQLHYLNTTTIYELDHLAGSLNLLYTLENGLRFDNLKLEMAKKGDRSLDGFKSVI